jgi:hypothetical protein
LSTVEVKLKRQYGIRCGTCGSAEDALIISTSSGQIVLCNKCLSRGASVFLAIEEQEDSPIQQKQKKSILRKSQAYEDQIAKDVGGRRQPASGGTRLAGYKGDVRAAGEYLIEHKFTESKVAYNLKFETLETVRRQAEMGGEEPVVCLTFRGHDRTYAIVNYSTFIEKMVNNEEKPKRR